VIVVADTSALCYLVLIGHIDLLPRLFGRVIVPQAVWEELKAQGAPSMVQTWTSQPPTWLEIQELLSNSDESLKQLHPGERETILLAEKLGANLVILDEKAARLVAIQRGLNVTGLLGILVEFASKRWIDLPDAIDRLQKTTFRASPRLLKSILDKFQEI
jgi:predicted nucleic acid-binding protein